MKIQLTMVEEMLFSLLKAALHGVKVTGVNWNEVTEDQWKECYKLAARHGVMALAWDGIQRMADVCMLPRSLKLTWALAVQNYEKQYERYCATATELAEFYAKHQINMVQLKGVGFSAYYPVPEHREGGDIDIYTWSADKNMMSDAEANSLADRLMMEQGNDVATDHTPKHSNFYYKGIPIENHKMFLNVDKYALAKPMDELLHKLLNPQSVELCGGKYKVNVPSDEFNALFIVFHAAQHYGSGIKVHHLFDWACLLKSKGWILPKEVKDDSLLDFISAMTLLSNSLLGTDVPIRGGEQMVETLFGQMMRPKYTEVVPVKGKLAILWFKTKRMMHIYKLQHSIFDMSLVQWIWKSIVVHIRKPETIFKT